jgi:ribosome maturation factor RimP
MWHLMREQQLETLLTPILNAMGYDVVRVQISGSRHPTMQVMAERKDEAAMTVDDCAEISRAISAVLDVEDPIEEAYQLEVSSPGIDRPLTRPQDYDRYAGFDARVELRNALDGRRRFKGKLLGVKDENVMLAVEGETVSVPLAAIQRAKLLLTDELIAASQSGKN